MGVGSGGLSQTPEVCGDLWGLSGGADGAGLGAIGIKPTGFGDLGFCVVGGLDAVGRSQGAI